MMNAHYKKLKAVNENLKAYEYDLEDDTKVKNLDTGEVTLTKSYINYKLNKVEKIARIIIELCIPDMNKEIDITFAHNKMCTSIRSPLKKTDEVTFIDEVGYNAMIQSGGALDLFNFGIFDIENMEVVQAGDELIFKGIGYNPMDLSAHTAYQPLHDIETGKYIIADARTYIIERAEAVKYTKANTGGYEIETEGVIKAVKCGVNDQVKIELPPECYR